MSKTTSTDIANHIRQLAKSHNISNVQDNISRMAVKITSLAGDNIELDGVEQLLINLKRKGVLTKNEILALQASYLKEKRSAHRKFRA